MVFRVRRQHSELVSTDVVIPAVGRVASPLRSTLLILLLAIRLVIRTEKQRIKGQEQVRLLNGHDSREHL